MRPHPDDQTALVRLPCSSGLPDPACSVVPARMGRSGGNMTGRDHAGGFSRPVTTNETPCLVAAAYADW